jgi:hypothetical protein
MSEIHRHRNCRVMMLLRSRHSRLAYTDPFEFHGLL